MTGKIATPWGVAFCFAVVALAHAALARLAGPALALDDAKLNVVAQSLQAGYLPANPPLFEWLLIGAQQAAGAGLLPFALVKATLFAATAGATFLAARELFGGRRAAAACAASLLLLFQYAWNFHQAYTHTTALVAATALLWLALLRLMRARTTGGYALLGAAIGLGLLAKYAFAGALVAALAALALQQPGRRVLADARLAAAFAFAALLVAPHALWLAGADAAGLAALAERAALGEEWRAGRAAARFVSAAGMIAAFFLPLAVVVAALLRGRLGALFAAPPPGARLARDAALIGAVGLLAAALAPGVAAIQDRYVIAFLYPAVFVAVAPLAAAPARLNALLLAAAAFTTLCLGARAVAALAPGPPFCDACRQYVDYRPLRAALAARGAGDAPALIGFDNTTAGNLRRLFPGARVISLHLPGYAPPPAPAGAPCFLVWSLDLAPPPPETFLAGIDEARRSVVESLTRPLAGERRRIVWTIADIDPGGPWYGSLCAGGA